jgi:hypothetical protein
MRRWPSAAYRSSAMDARRRRRRSCRRPRPGKPGLSPCRSSRRSRRTACNSIDRAGESPALGVVRCAQVVISGTSGGRPLGVESDVQVPDGPAVSVEVGWLRGRASLGAVASSERCSVVNASTESSLSVGECSRPAVESWERRASVAWAKASVCGEETRRMGGGTKAGIGVQRGEGLRSSQDPTAWQTKVSVLSASPDEGRTARCRASRERRRRCQEPPPVRK